MLSLFPNPTNGALTIKIALTNEEDVEAKIEVLNLLGQIIISEKETLDEGKLQKEIQLRDAAAVGMYMVKVTMGNQVYTSQFNFQK